MFLNNGNVNKRKLLQKKLNDLKSYKKERALINTLATSNGVACSNDKAIITLEQNPQCDFVMRKENKKKILELINSEEELIKDYYAIPASVWEILLQEYTKQFRAGNKKPTLPHINIDVRLYDEEESKESEMQKIAYEIFGDLANFE